MGIVWIGLSKCVVSNGEHFDGVSEVVLWCYSDGYQGQEGAHDRGAKWHDYIVSARYERTGGVKRLRMVWRVLLTLIYRNNLRYPSFLT